ncbi:MAG: hypothetical protein ACLQPD_12865 [Desulfomonilaceae bacterium]
MILSGMGAVIIMVLAPPFLATFYIYFVALILVTGLLATNLNVVSLLAT